MNGLKGAGRAISGVIDARNTSFGEIVAQLTTLRGKLETSLSRVAYLGDRIYGQRPEEVSKSNAQVPAPALCGTFHEVSDKVKELLALADMIDGAIARIEAYIPSGYVMIDSALDFGAWLRPCLTNLAVRLYAPRLS
jgi:hypothetical protein